MATSRTRRRDCGNVPPAQGKAEQNVYEAVRERPGQKARPLASVGVCTRLGGDTTWRRRVLGWRSGSARAHAEERGGMET